MIELGRGGGGLWIGMRRGVYLIERVWRYGAVCPWLVSSELPSVSFATIFFSLPFCLEM